MLIAFYVCKVAFLGIVIYPLNKVAIKYDLKIKGRIRRMKKELHK